MPALGLSLGLPFGRRSSGAAAPGVPTGFTATAGNQLTALSWDAQISADTFEIYFSTTNDFGTASQLTDTPTGTGFVHNTAAGIQPGEKYYYWIRAINGEGKSDWSDGSTSSVTARSYVTVPDSGTVNLTTPAGSWTLTTLFFRTEGNLPASAIVGYNGGADVGVSVGDGTWEDLINGGTFDPSISGAFDFNNSTGATVTFWNTEP